MDFPRYFCEDNLHTFNIVGYIDDFDRYIDGKAYANRDGNIYIYSSTPLDPYDRADKVPRFWSTPKGLEFIEDGTKNGLYTLDNTIACTLDEIIDATPEGYVPYDEEMIADMNSSMGVYIPTISEKDDYLKRLVKEVILAKKVDISSYKSRMDKKYRLTNMKSALDGTTKMTVTVFLMWADLLNFKFEIKVTDAGPSMLPIGGVMKYNSVTDEITLEKEEEDDDE